LFKGEMIFVGEFLRHENFLWQENNDNET
jgi:hypothetical protein